MKKALLALLLVGISACHSDESIPNVDDFKKDPALLKTWLDKCYHGEYSHLEATEQMNKCENAFNAQASLSNAAAVKANSDTLKANSIGGDHN